VVGPDYAGRASGAATVRDPDDLPRRVAEADLVVIGGGTMKFEVAALGRPAILLAASDDQLPVGPPFASTGAAVWLGDGRAVEPEMVHQVIAELLADDPARAAMSEAGRRTVDGGGADRLAAEIAALADGQMSAS
jgi:spore coat polysaccharide biosynthesis predicted glycosyltransferase SpsG